MNITQSELLNLDITEYFKRIENVIDRSISLDEVTHLFSDLKFTETKPYLTRRILIPNDNRFKSIEIVYDKNIKAIVWEMNFTLSELTEIFGPPSMHNENFSEATVFTFKSANQFIDVILTRHPEWLIKMEGNNSFKYEDVEGKYKIILNPEFSFIQYDLKN